jgi:hypothetical protein
MPYVDGHGRVVDRKPLPPFWLWPINAFWWVMNSLGLFFGTMIEVRRGNDALAPLPPGHDRAPPPPFSVGPAEALGRH